MPWFCANFPAAQAVQTVAAAVVEMEPLWQLTQYRLPVLAAYFPAIEGGVVGRDAQKYDAYSEGLYSGGQAE